MAKHLLLLLAVLLLSACKDPPHPKYAVSQAKREALFDKCLANIPVGPTSVKYNDWDEVVKVCDRVSRDQAKYCIAHCDSIQDYEGRLEP